MAASGEAPGIRAAGAGQAATAIAFSRQAMDLYLDVDVNGVARGLYHFDYRDGDLWASPAVLRDVGLALPDGTVGPVRIGSLPGIQAGYDASRQRVLITGTPDKLNLPVAQINADDSVARLATSSPGLLLNYDLYGSQYQGGAASLSAFTELRAFRGNSVISNTALSQVMRGEVGLDASQTVRLDTTWSTSFPDKPVTLRVGDTLTGAVSWSRATRIGGIQLSRDFALQPYRNTAPLPAFFGSVTVPSNVDLFINGIRQYSNPIQPGPFQLNAAPGISGAGNAQVVLTDALGRSRTLDFPIYSTSQLLQKGLSDWSVDIGTVRKDYGLSSFSYGRDPVATGSLRYGLSNSFTAESHGETARGLVNMGVGGVWSPGQAGVLSSSISHSAYQGLGGWQWSAGYQWNNNRFNFGAHASGTRGDYLDIAALYEAPVLQGSQGVNAGYSTQYLGSFGASYFSQDYSDLGRARYGSLYWFMSLGQSTTLSLNVNQNLDDRAERAVFFGISIALDGNVTASAGMQRDRDNTFFTADASRPVPSEGGFGWSAGSRAGAGDMNGGQAQADYLGRYGQLSAGVSSFGGNSYAFGGASGALVLMGGHTFAARRVDDAFAVVSTSGVAGVPVKLENLPVGVTDKNGMLLVTPLRSYQNNKIAIDAMNLPIDMRIERVVALSTPSDRAGNLVRFNIQRVRAASIILIGADGRPLAIGSLVHQEGKNVQALVGFDGLVYLDSLEKSNVLDIETPEVAGHPESRRTCRVRFEYPADSRGLPQIGPLKCAQGAKP
jgi:outer membrane usher protein